MLGDFPATSCFEKFCSEFGSGGFVFVFEEDIGMIPSLRANPLFPVSQVGATVFSPTQPQISPTRRVDQITNFPLIDVGPTERAVARLQRDKDLLVEPGWMPELKRHVPISGQKC